MGMSSGSVVNDALKLCLFDLRRGQNEGQELDKILFFYPADLPFSAQLSVIGLSEGLITFTRIFSPEAACEVIEAEMHSHVFYEPEPDIWMIMVVEKSKECEALWRTDALRAFLIEIHSLFVMFHGSIRALLDKEPAGGLVRTLLYYFVMDYLSDFFTAKKLQLPNFRESLNERGTVQILTMGREAALEVQSLVKALETSTGSSPCYSLIMCQDLLVSSNLSHDDTVNLYTYAVLRLSSRALPSGVSSWSYLRKGNVTPSVPYGPLLQNPDIILDQHNGSHETSYFGDRNDNVMRPMKPDKWFRGKDCFLVTDHWGAANGRSAQKHPTVFLSHTEERMFLCAYQHRSLSVIFLIPATSVLDEEQGISLMKQKIIDDLAFKMMKVEEKLSSGWGGENAYHVPGYRYLLVDGDRHISRASPPGKVTTLSKESLTALSKLREEVDLEKHRGKWDGVSIEKDTEMCIRAKNNAWVIARTTKGKELYMVLEKASETLLYASDAVEKFSDRYCFGAFSLD